MAMTPNLVTMSRENMLAIIEFAQTHPLWDTNNVALWAEEGDMLHKHDAHLSAQTKVRVNDGEAIKLLRAILGDSYTHLSGECLVDAKHSARSFLESFAARLSQDAQGEAHDDDEWGAGNCNVCGRPVLYGERHSTCGTAIMEAEKKARAERAAVPDGWVLVPSEPTSMMVNAGVDVISTDADQTYQDLFREGYKAMLTAAPRPPEGARVAPDGAVIVGSVIDADSYGLTAHFPKPFPFAGTLWLAAPTLARKEGAK